MTDLERMLIEHACARLVADYGYYADNGPQAAFADLFTEDGVLGLPTGETRGRAAVGQGGMPAGLVTRHSMSNVRITALSDTEAEGTSYLTLYVARRPDPDKPAETKIAAPTNVGVYVDRYRKTPDGWRIAERRYQPSIVRAAAG